MPAPPATQMDTRNLRWRDATDNKKAVLAGKRLLARLMKYHSDEDNRHKSIRKLERELGVDHAKNASTHMDR